MLELVGGIPTLDVENRVHQEPFDDYTLSGANWLGVWPDLLTRNGDTRLHVVYRNFRESGVPDLFERQMVRELGLNASSMPPTLVVSGGTLHRGTVVLDLGFNRSALANLILEERRIDILDHEVNGSAIFKTGLYEHPVATLAAGVSLLAVPGNVEDAILQVGSNVALVQGSVTDDGRYLGRRLGTTLASEIARRLFSSGLDGVLDLSTQRALAEAGLPLTPVGGQVIDRTGGTQLDFTGPYGAYYRELFFHVPVLLASQLTARGRFAAAQRWLHKVFDPTATEVVTVPPNTPSEERARLLRARCSSAAVGRGLRRELAIRGGPSRSLGAARSRLAQATTRAGVGLGCPRRATVDTTHGAT